MSVHSSVGVGGGSGLFTTATWKLRLLFRKKGRLGFRSTQKAMVHGYIVLFPELPADTTVQTASQQKLLSACVLENRLPPYKDWRADENLLVAAKSVLEFDVWAFEHCENFQDQSKVRNFESVFAPIEKELSKSESIWAFARQAITTTKADSSDFHEAASVQSAISRARYTLHSNYYFYTAAKEVAADRQNLNKWQERLVNKYLLEGRLNGMDLSFLEKTKLSEASVSLENHKRSFIANIAQTYAGFDHIIPSLKELNGAPEHVLRQLTCDPEKPRKGPWRVILMPSYYWPFMRYCSTRPRRYNAWFAWNTRAGFFDPRTNNSINIEEIRSDRLDEAENLGFKSYNDLSMQTKMAGSTDIVMKFLTTLRAKFQGKFARRYNELHDFAQLEDLVSDQLQPWDLNYYFYRQALVAHSVDETELANFFPFSFVMEEIFAITEKLFDITFKEVTENSERLHPDVRVFEVHSESFIGHLILDPYSRPGKKHTFWIDSGRVRNDLLGVKPVVFLNLSVTKSEKDGANSVLAWEELKSTLSQFGRSLQFLLTKCPYPEIAGLNNVEWDAVHCIDYFMEHLLHQPSLMHRLSRHVETGEALSLHRCKQISNCTRPFWLEIYKRIWKEYFPFEQNKDDYMPCSFTPIFTQQLASAYYSHLWSEMLACDMMSAFEEQGFDNMDKIRPVARRFKETVLEIGGGRPFQEIFRNFMNRDPSVVPLCNFYNAGAAR